MIGITGLGIRLQHFPDVIISKYYYFVFLSICHLLKSADKNTLFDHGFYNDILPIDTGIFFV